MEKKKMSYFGLSGALSTLGLDSRHFVLIPLANENAFTKERSGESQ
jgi:hypothetical protein